MIWAHQHELPVELHNHLRRLSRPLQGPVKSLGSILWLLIIGLPYAALTAAALAHISKQLLLPIQPVFVTPRSYKRLREQLRKLF